MSTVRTCSLDYCKNSLSSLSSLGTGLCDEHLKELQSDKHVVGVCWNCNRITVIDEIPHRLKKEWQDKYLFTKTCSHCAENGKDNAWITFKRFDPKEELVVSPIGKLIKQTKDRTAETELPNNVTIN